MSQFPENEFQLEKVHEYLNKSQEYLSRSEEFLNQSQDSIHNGNGVPGADPLANLNGGIQEDQKQKEKSQKKLKVDELDDGKIILNKGQGKKIIEDKEEIIEVKDKSLDHYSNNDLNNPANMFKDKKGNPIKAAVNDVEVLYPREVPANLTWDAMNEAAKEFFYVRKVAYEVRRKTGKVDRNFNENARWSDLSANQKYKRKQKGIGKKLLRETALDFAKKRDEKKQAQNDPHAQPVMEHDPEEQEISEFLDINLDAFQLDDDQQFMTHRVRNYALADRVEPMERFLERVVSGQSELPADRMEAISKQIAFLKEIREWMDARLELIQDPYYVLLSSRELTDSAEVLEGLNAMKGRYKATNPEDADAIPNVVKFLQRYENVKNCTFNRRRSRDTQDLTYRNEFREQTDVKGVEKNRDLARRKQIRIERETKEQWQTMARQIALEKKDAKLPVKHATATMELFREKSKAFLALDLSAFHFRGIAEILQHYAVHDALFDQAREMQWILADVSQDEQNRIPDHELIKVRARLALFSSLRRRQTKALRELTVKGGAMENLSLQEWIREHDLVLDLDPKLVEEKYLDEYSKQNDNAENRIMEIYAHLKPGQELSKEEIKQAKDRFQKNLIFWESLKHAKTELSSQDDETMMFLNSYYQDKHLNMPKIGKNLLIHLRGKSKAETETILQRYSGTPAERMQLEKEIADQALAEAKHLEGFRVNPDNPSSFLKDIGYKLHQTDLLSVAADSVDQIELLYADHKDAALPEGYTAEYKKELQALSEFAKDHIDTRMKTMTGVADQVDIALLGAVDIREFKALKADRKAIDIDLKNVAQEKRSVTWDAAKAFFDTADRLFKNESELADLYAGEKQRVASAHASIDSVYQSYRLAYGIQEKLNEVEAAKKKSLEYIEGISENPIYSSREELQGLRDRCISALSEYEKNIPEYLYYDLTTPVLKQLAIRKLRENVDSKMIQEVIDLHQAAGLRRETDEEQPEWGEKEKNALLFMGNLAGMEKEEKEEGAELLKLLDDHAEILADMGRIAMSDEKKKKTDLKRYRELMHKVETGENLKSILKEEEDALLEMQKRVENATDKEKADKSYMAYLNGQVKMHQKEVDSIKERMEDWTKNEKAYRRELKGLAYLDAVQKEIENKELELKNDYEVYEKLTQEKVNLDIFRLDHQLHHLFKKMDKITMERKTTQDTYDKYAAEKVKDNDELESLQERLDEYDKNLEMAAAEIKKLEQEKKDKKNNAAELKKAESAEAAALKKEIEKKEQELEKLKTGPDVSLDVFACMNRRLEGPDSVLAHEIGTHLSGVVDYLVQKSGDKVLRLSSVRRLLKEKDPQLIALLKEAKRKIRASMDKAYRDVCEEIKDVIPAMFENLNANMDSMFSEIKQFETGEGEKRKAYYSHEYDETDRENDRKEMERIQKETQEALRELETHKYDEKERERRQKEILKNKENQLADVGPDALYQRQAKAVFKFNVVPKMPKQEITLEMLHNKNWAYDPDEPEQPGEGTFVRNVMRNYFDKVSNQDKQSMMKAMLFSLKPMIRDHKHAKTNSLKRTGMHLAGLLRGAGPLMQKLMQGMPQEYMMQELCDAVEDMKSNLEPIPDKYVNKMFDQMKTDSKGQITEIKKLQSLGAASVGQAFLCRVTGPGFPKGKQVVIKLLRPGAGERIDREEKIMKDCAKSTSEGMLATYEGQLTKVREELDLRKEARNVRDGVTAYESKKGDNTPGICKTVHTLDELPATKDYLVLDKAEGETYDRYIGRIVKNRALWRKPFLSVRVDFYTGKKTVKGELVLTSENIGMIPEVRPKLVAELQSVVKRRQHLEKVTERWIEESIFNDGFYHGDMHAGNLMAHDDQTTILDYGNATRLTNDEVTKILGMYAGAMYGDARAFLDHFLGLLPEDQMKKLTGEDQQDPKAAFEQMKKFTIQKNELRKKIYSIFRRGIAESQVGEKMYLALTEMQKNGFQIPISIYSYVQSEMRLNNTLNELDTQEIGLRNDIKRLDCIRGGGSQEPSSDLLMRAQDGARSSQDKEAYYRTLIHALEEPNEKEFVSLLAESKKDPKQKAVFEKQYMSMFDRINNLMAGKAVYGSDGLHPDDYDDEETETEETDKIPVPVLNVEEWKKEYETYMKLYQEDQAMEEKITLEKNRGLRKDLKAYKDSKLHKDCENARSALQTKLNYVFMIPDRYLPNGLMEGFGDYAEMIGTVGDAMMGDRMAFNDFVGLVENTILPLIDLAKDLRAFLDSGKNMDPKVLFLRYKRIANVMSERHKSIADIRNLISYDRRGYVQNLKIADMEDLKIEKTDTEEFRTLFPRWKELHEKEKKREALSPEEGKEHAELGQRLRECRRVGTQIHAFYDRLQFIDDPLATWFKGPGGHELYNAYREFAKLRDQDIENRRKKCDDDSLLDARIKAENKFLSIYRGIAVNRVKKHVEAFKLKVPEEGKLRDFSDVFEDYVRAGGLLAYGRKAGKIAGAVGFSKGNSYRSGTYVAGLDLEDSIPEKIGDVPKPIIRKVPWTDEEEVDKKNVINEEDKKNVINEEEDKNLIIDTSSNNRNEIIE